MSVCDILTPTCAPTRGYAPCGKPAIARIAAPDGSGGLYTCGSHRDAVIVLVASRTSLTGPLQYTPVGTHADAVKRERTRKES